MMKWEHPLNFTVPTYVRPIREPDYVRQTHYMYGEKPYVWRQGEVS